MSLNLSENVPSATQREILDLLPVILFLERDGQIVEANAIARQVMGEPDQPWTPRPIADVLWSIAPAHAEYWSPQNAGRHSIPFQAMLPGKRGLLVPVEGHYNPFNPEQRGAVIIAHPARREDEQAPDAAQELLASIPDAIAIVHGGSVWYTNPAFTRIFGYTAPEMSGGELAKLIVPDTRRHESDVVDKTVRNNQQMALETQRKNKRGDLVDVALLAAPLVINGVNIGSVQSFRDIGDRKRVEAKLQHDALHDVLTGLSNRALFLDRLHLALSRRARRGDQTCGVLFLDLDRFKEVNDTLGHAAGDALLVAVAARLTTAIRPQDTAARLGGDEFALLIENITSINDLEIVAERVSREMQKPFEIAGQPFVAGASIGVAMAGPDHTAPELLIRDADFAMYRAKQDGGGHFEIYDKHLKVRATAQLKREQELRNVLDSRAFEVWFAPIFRLEDGRLEGFEAALHLPRPVDPDVSFQDLLAVAEETGLTITIGREMIEKTCRQLHLWDGKLPSANLSLSVDLSHRQFYHPDLIAQLKRTLAATRADPQRLLVEVSEITLCDNLEAAAVILQRIADCNVRVAVDHFGAGLAPLHLLTRLRVDVLKLSSELTATAALSGRSMALLQLLIQMGRSTGIQVIAQGITTQAQLSALLRAGCELGQGSLLSPALDPLESEDLARAGRRSGLRKQGDSI